MERSRNRDRGRAFLLACTAALAVVMLLPAAVEASEAGTPEAVVARFADHEVAWNIDICSGTPVAYDQNVLVGVGLSSSERDAAAEALGPDLVAMGDAPYGTTVFELGSHVDAIKLRAGVHADVGVTLHLNHVFFFNPVWRFSPETAPTRTARTPYIAGYGSIERPVFVVDTGYPASADAPRDYQLGLDSRIKIDERSRTANHGPFIASQIAQLAPSDAKGASGVVLQRVLVEKGLLRQPTTPGAEDVFDEIALLATLFELDLARHPNAVVNLSFGTYGCQNDAPAALLHALTYEADKHGSHFVAAAGNDETGERHFPAAFADEASWVTAVGAHQGDPLHAKEAKRACFSNFGSVTVWAPGVDVLGRIPGVGSGELASASGTSFASAFVTAAIAADRDLSDERLGLFHHVGDDRGRSSADGSACR